MLQDIKRKVLRILWNYSSVQRRLPTLRELCVKTGKTEAVIHRILMKLQEENFIAWDGMVTSSIIIIKGWENESPQPISNNTATGKMYTRNVYKSQN